jgi:hypothetical protein
MNWLPNFITGQLPPQMQIATTTHTRNSRLIGCGREEGVLADRAGAAMAVDIRGSRGETARRSRHPAESMLQRIQTAPMVEKRRQIVLPYLTGGKYPGSTSCCQIVFLKIIYLQ